MGHLGTFLNLIFISSASRLVNVFSLCVLECTAHAFFHMQIRTSIKIQHSVVAKVEQIKMHGSKVYKPFKVLMDAGTVQLVGRNLSEILKPPPGM